MRRKDREVLGDEKVVFQIKNKSNNSNFYAPQTVRNGAMSWRNDSKSATPAQWPEVTNGAGMTNVGLQSVIPFGLCFCKFIPAGLEFN